MGKVIGAILLGLFFVFFGAPALMLVASKAMINNMLSDSVDPVMRRYNSRDVIYGHDRKSLSALAKSLRNVSAQPAEAKANRRLHVAIVEIPPGASSGPQANAPPPKLTVDLGRAGDAAVVLIKSNPMTLRVENASSDQRGKIGVEGAGPFVLENAPEGVLSGFRIDAFGADDPSTPKDYFENGKGGRNGRFCDSVDEWAALYGVNPDAMQIFVYSAPGRIVVLPNGLSGSPAPKSSPTWTAGIECRDKQQAYAPSPYREPYE